MMSGCKTVDYHVTEDTSAFVFGQNTSKQVVYCTVNSRTPVWRNKMPNSVVDNLYRFAMLKYPDAIVIATNNFFRKQIEWNESGYELTLIIDASHK
jgi:hypothetical protein